MRGVHQTTTNKRKNCEPIFRFHPKNEKNKKDEEKSIGMQPTK